MKKIICVLFAGILFFAGSAYAQDVRWNLGMDYFFDNMEYARSSYVSSQTLNGVWFKPLAGYSVDSVHALYGGLNLLKIPGTSKTIDKTELTLFYEYQTPAVLFRAGAFPRREVLGNYSDFFFKDSISNLKPLMRGIFWQVGKRGRFFNAWMDWTGYPSDSVRESFFVGLSGRISHKAFFADFQSYMFHYANTSVPGSHGVSENLQAQASAGAEWQIGKGFAGSLSAGMLAGYERDRKRDDKPYTPVGFTLCAQAEYMGFGTKNTLYLGDARMKHYARYGDGLYWGTQFLRGKSYFKSNWYARLIDSKYAIARLDLNFHFSEQSLMSEQLFTVVVSFDNFKNREPARKAFPWGEIFR